MATELLVMRGEPLFDEPIHVRVHTGEEICNDTLYSNMNSMACPTYYVQFVIIYSLFKIHVPEATCICNFLFSNHVNSGILSKINLISYQYNTSICPIFDVYFLHYNTYVTE